MVTARSASWGLLALVLTANVVVFWALASDVAAGALTLGAVAVFAQAAVGTSLVCPGYVFAGIVAAL